MDWVTLIEEFKSLCFIYLLKRRKGTSPVEVAAWQSAKHYHILIAGAVRSGMDEYSSRSS